MFKNSFIALKWISNPLVDIKGEKIMYKIEISLKSHTPLFIKKGIKNLQKLFKTLPETHSAVENRGGGEREKVFEGIRVESSQKIPFPILRKRWTVLRSPHIDKKSREQFEWARWKEKIHFFSTERKGFFALLSFLRHSEFPGVEFHLQLHSFTFFKKNAKKK
jgi:ribosomal protein S10